MKNKFNKEMGAQQPPPANTINPASANYPASLYRVNPVSESLGPLRHIKQRERLTIGLGLILLEQCDWNRIIRERRKCKSATLSNALVSLETVQTDCGLNADTIKH